MDITHSGDNLRPALDECCRAALQRILEESGKPLASVAGAMGYTESRLRQLVSGGAWSAEAICAMASATGQNPVEMLWREAP